MPSPLLLSLLLALPVGLAAEVRNAARPVPVALDENGLPIVSVTLHSLKTPGLSRTFRFILDTGAGWCAVDKSVPTEFFWNDPHIQTTLRDVADQAVPAETVVLKRVEVGDLSRDMIQATRVDLRAQMGRFQDQPVDGILGMSFLHGTRFLLEPAEGRLVWWGNHPSPGATLPLADSADHLPSLSLRLGGQSVLAEVDTGSTGGLDLPASMDAEASGQATLSQGLSGVTLSGRERVPSAVETGAFAWVRPAVDFQAEAKVGRIGLDVWLADRVCFDFTTRQVTLTPDRTGNLPLRREPHRRLPLMWDRTGAEPRLVIALVKPGSPMEKAGCRVGDLLVRVGSLRDAALTRRAVQDLVASGVPHTWTVLRAGTEVQLTFPAP